MHLSPLIWDPGFSKRPRSSFGTGSGLVSHLRACRVFMKGDGDVFFCCVWMSYASVFDTEIPNVGTSVRLSLS